MPMMVPLLGRVDSELPSSFSTAAEEEVAALPKSDDVFCDVPAAALSTEDVDSAEVVLPGDVETVLVVSVDVADTVLVARADVGVVETMLVLVVAVSSLLSLTQNSADTKPPFC